MEKINEQVYRKIDNNFYNAEGDIWWKPDTILHLLKTSVNPWKAGYSNGIAAISFNRPFITKLL